MSCGEGRGVKGRWGASGASSPEGGGGPSVREGRDEMRPGGFDAARAERVNRCRGPFTAQAECNAVEPNGPALRGMDECGKEGSGGSGWWGGRVCIALVGCCPRGRAYAGCRSKVTRKTGARCRSSLSVVREIRVTESDGRAPSGLPPCRRSLSPQLAAAAFRPGYCSRFSRKMFRWASSGLRRSSSTNSTSSSTSATASR